MQAIPKPIDIAKESAINAGNLIIGLLNKASISEKGNSNLVTEADIKAEKLIKDTILKTFPQHSILGEEGGGEKDMSAPHLWIIDPLDGTNNYAHGFPIFSVSIAYAECGEVKAGVVYDPTRNELFSAEKQRGAFLNRERIQVSINPLSKAIVSVGFSYERGKKMQAMLKTIEKLFSKNIHGIRRCGSAALDLCYVASGRTDAYVEYEICPWDFAAGMLILNEAGGVCKNATGGVLDLNAKNLAVSNLACSKEFIKTVIIPNDTLN